MKGNTLNYLTYLQSLDPDRINEHEFFIAILQDKQGIKALRRSWVDYTTPETSIDTLVVTAFGYGPVVEKDRFIAETFPIDKFRKLVWDYLETSGYQTKEEKSIIKRNIENNIDNMDFSAVVRSYNPEFNLPDKGIELLANETLNLISSVSVSKLVIATQILEKIDKALISNLHVEEIPNANQSTKESLEYVSNNISGENIYALSYPDEIFDVCNWLKKITNKKIFSVKPNDLSGIFYETDNFVLYNPEKPHICKQDGGHLLLSWKEHMGKGYDLRPDEVPVVLNSEAAREYGGLLERVKPSMVRMLDLYTVNLQQNGNWTYLRRHLNLLKTLDDYNKKELISDIFPKNHTHLLGRSWQDTYLQTPFQTVVLPDPRFKYDLYLERIDKSQIYSLLKDISR